MAMLRYTESLEDITPDHLTGFFVGWPQQPSPDTHMKLLRGSNHVCLAIDDETNKVVGFVTAITDGVMSAYIPFLEVTPAYQNQGIGRELVRRVLEGLSSYYMVDLTCDPELQAWYEGLGFQKSTGMSLRNYAKQTGA